MPDVVNSVVINYKSVGLDKVGADLKGASTAIDGLVVSSATAFKATTELENKFKGLQKTTSAYTTALGEARGAAMGLAAGIGPLGAVLGSFGPWGVAAAAGIGLVTSAFTYMSEGAAKMGDEAVKLQQFSDITGLTTTQVRGLSEAGQEVGVSAEAVKKGLEKFTVGLADVREGSGDLFQQLKAIDEQLAIQMSQTRNSGEALDLLTKAYNSTTDATTKAALARAAFGRGGLEVGQVLGVLTEGVDKYSSAVERSLGVTGDMTKKMSDQSKQITDLKGDIETMNAALYAPEVLARQLQFLEGQKRIAAAMLELKASGAGFAPDIGGVGGFGTAPPQFSVPQEVTGEAGRGGMARGAAAAAAAAAAEVAVLEEKWKGVSAETRKASEIAEHMIPVYQAVGGAAQRTAQFSADISIELIKGKTAADALVIAADKLIAAEAKAFASVAATTRSLEEQNELAKARDINDEKRIASQQAYEKVIKDLGDTEAGRAAAQERAAAVEESYRTKIADKTGEAAIHARELQNAFNATVFSAQAVAEATDIIAENTARAAKTAADFSRAMQLGTFAPNVMPTGQLSFTADPRATVSYRGGGRGRDIQAGFDIKGFNPAYVDPNAVWREANKKTGTDRPVKELTDSIDKLTSSTDDLNRTNQELLSPYYTQDPRTSHIGFRSQGMANGGYVDVPGGYSANDNMTAIIPVASGERIYVDPMASRRGGGGATINISAPMTFTGPANRDEVGRTVYQAMQSAARSIAAASR